MNTFIKERNTIVAILEQNMLFKLLVGQRLWSALYWVCKIENARKYQGTAATSKRSAAHHSWILATNRRTLINRQISQISVSAWIRFRISNFSGSGSGSGVSTRILDPDPDPRRKSVQKLRKKKRIVKKVLMTEGSGFLAESRSVLDKFIDPDPV